MARGPRPATTWHIIATQGSGDGRRCASYAVAPAAPRVLAAAAAPWRATHRLARVRRQRVRGNLSHVRLTLAPRASGPPVQIAAMMIRRAPDSDSPPFPSPRG